MLRYLSVRHLAIIDELEVEFEPGLTIITGETGAGKSILVEAIDLLVGGRASADLVRSGEATAVVQAIFDRPDGRETIVRREISSQGRSRAFIDDVLATSAALKEQGQHLVDLHGQHEHQSLLDPAAQLEHLDAFGNHGALRAETASAFDAWRAAASALDRSQLDDREKRARIEIASFQLQEIDQAAPEPGEDDALAAERRVLANAERLMRLSTEAYGALYDSDGAVLPALAGIWKRLSELAAIDASFAPHLEATTALKPALEDLAFALRSYAARFDESPARLQEVEDRLALLERLKRKYGPTLADVIARRAALRDELTSLDASEERVAALEAEERRTRAIFEQHAAALSAARREAAARLGRGLARELSELAMPRCQVDVRVETEARPDAWTRTGTDAVEFFLSPNPGEELRPLARIASGGELSRIMLAMRTLVTTDAPGRTLVFDEVDAGIGGAAADAVGARLQALGERHQVLCITHLPQVAARGTAHFHISKDVAAGRTSTRIARLDAGGRELEIARMIAGASVSAKVLSSARELIATRRGESELKAKGESAHGAKAKGRPRGA